MMLKKRGLRRSGGVLAVVMLAGFLVACGGESDAEPTVTPIATVAATSVPTIVVTADLSTPDVATPEASPVASPIASPVGSPIALATASPEASPIASPIASPVARTTWPLTGSVSLPGIENERFVISGDGCVGLGKYAGVQAGQQVVVENAMGAVIGVATLADSGSQIDCVWTFEVDVPVSDFYTISLPLLFERVYSDADMTLVDGRLQITLP